MLIELIVLVVIVLLSVVWWFGCREGGRIDGRGKGVLVTGAASGIGLAAAKLLFARGCHVYASDLSGDSVRRSLAAELAAAAGRDGGGKITVLEMDVTSDAQVEAARRLIEGNGDLFAVLNNAGIAPSTAQSKPRGIDEIEVGSREGRLIWEVNVFGVLRVTQRFADLLPSDGAVVTVASVAGLFAGPFFGYYSMTKFAVVSFMDTLRRENAATAKRFVTVCPGFTDTPLLSDLDRQVDPSLTRHHRVLSSPQVARQRTTIMRTAQPVAVVADVIVDHALLRRHPRPLIVVDTPRNRLMWFIAQLLPRRSIDALFRSAFS